MRYIFHPEALQEYQESAVYYSKISRELAVSFINSANREEKGQTKNPSIVDREGIRVYYYREEKNGTYKRSKNRVS